MKTRSILALVLFAAAAAVALPAAAADAPPFFADAAGDCAAPAAAAPAAAEPIFLVGEVCGSKICGKGTYCCNASCSRCVPFGMSCTQEACSVATATEQQPVEVDHGGFHFDVPCGDNVCTGGNFCCNASCGICAPRGGHCTQQVCNPTS
ncbi:MAG TPA: hypothetical protein VHM02_09335 [Thermoanaerobaculia bacterium]|nr:hypothetical protein [Thermoanaerobaculia bacterium]